MVLLLLQTSALKLTRSKNKDLGQIIFEIIIYLYYLSILSVNFNSINLMNKYSFSQNLDLKYKTSNFADMY